LIDVGVAPVAIDRQEGIGDALERRGQSLGQALYILLRLFLFGDILQCAAEMTDDAVVAGHRLADHSKPDAAIGCGNDLQLVLERRAFADTLLQDRASVIPPFGRAIADGLLDRESRARWLVVDRAGLVRPDESTVHQVDAPASDPSRAAGDRQQALALAARPIGPVALDGRADNFGQSPQQPDLVAAPMAFAMHNVEADVGLHHGIGDDRHEQGRMDMLGAQDFLFARPFRAEITHARDLQQLPVFDAVHHLRRVVTGPGLQVQRRDTGGRPFECRRQRGEVAVDVEQITAIDPAVFAQPAQGSGYGVIDLARRGGDQLTADLDQVALQARDVFEGLFVVLGARDIDHDADELARSAILDDHVDEVPQPDHAAIRRDHAVVEFVRSHPGCGLAAIIRRPGPVVRVHVIDPERAFLGPALGRVAQQALGLAADERESE